MVRIWGKPGENTPRRDLFSSVVPLIDCFHICGRPLFVCTARFEVGGRLSLAGGGLSLAREISIQRTWSLARGGAKLKKNGTLYLACIDELLSPSVFGLSIAWAPLTRVSTNSFLKY